MKKRQKPTLKVSVFQENTKRIFVNINVCFVTKRMFRLNVCFVNRNNFLIFSQDSDFIDLKVALH